MAVPSAGLFWAAVAIYLVGLGILSALAPRVLRTLQQRRLAEPSEEHGAKILFEASEALLGTKVRNPLGAEEQDYGWFEPEPSTELDHAIS